MGANMPVFCGGDGSVELQAGAAMGPGSGGIEQVLNVSTTSVGVVVENVGVPDRNDQEGGYGSLVRTSDGGSNMGNRMGANMVEVLRWSWVIRW